MTKTTSAESSERSEQIRELREAINDFGHENFRSGIGDATDTKAAYARVCEALRALGIE